jgi:hypothetical protein
MTLGSEGVPEAAALEFCRLRGRGCDQRMVVGRALKAATLRPVLGVPG